MKERKFIQISATFPPDLIGEIESRAGVLDLTRSQYLRQLVRRDLENVAKSTPETKPEPEPVPHSAAA